MKYLCAEKWNWKEIMEGNQSRRIDFVDLTKGVCIILVVIAHVGGAFEQLDTNSMLSCFRMPLYFFISGVFFKSYEGLFGFILRKINKLIIPFLFFYLSAFRLENSTRGISTACIMEWALGSVSWTWPYQVQSSDLVSTCTIQLQYPVLSDPLSAWETPAYHVCCHTPDWLHRILSRKVTDRVAFVYRCFHDRPPFLCSRFLDSAV